MRDLVRLARRTRGKPPRVILGRALNEAGQEIERYRAPRRARRFDRAALLRATGDPDLEALWQRLATRPYPAVTTRQAAAEVARLCPGERERVEELAEQAIGRRVDLLGSGLTELGHPIDWLVDFKTGIRWEPGYGPRLDVADLERPSDVKVPWELSRMQWLIPAAQAFLLTGDERYAASVRDLLDEWIAGNPHAETVNWACTMDVAIRAMSWTYFFHVFHDSRAWAEAAFRDRFLCSLFMHGDFTIRHLERSEVNGNHYTADAAGLVFLGRFFGRGDQPRLWLERGWTILCSELPRQVFPDGIDYEASTAYHRLVLELFLLPALYQTAQGAPPAEDYARRLCAMAHFSATYARPDGTIPLWGDADDARALPLGSQALNDHRYLAGVVGLAFETDELLAFHNGSRSEAAWLRGAGPASRLPETPAEPGTTAFPDGGVYVLRGGGDHVFIDAGPVGLAGRGGHGHNDCLSFDAVLDGTHLVADCGAYIYTASPTWRNHFRGTAAHNTPQVDGEEINRIPESLWFLSEDARPEVREFSSENGIDRLTAAHSGYRRLHAPLTPVRTFVLDRRRHALAVLDSFEGTGDHVISVPYHMAPGLTIREVGHGRFILDARGRQFSLGVDLQPGWDATIEEGWFSPSYGVKVAVACLCLRRAGPPAALLVAISPGAGGDPLEWASDAVRR